LRHNLVRRLPYAPEQLFDLVGDVERYPLFIPWITSLRTWNRRGDALQTQTLDAEAQVRFSVVRERFTTRVALDRSDLRIDVALVAGPFRRLKNQWTFVPHESGGELTFDIDFEFGSRFLTNLLAANFEVAVTRLIACFEARALKLYGPRSNG